MKKILTLALCLCLTLSIASCGAPAGETSGSPSPSGSESADPSQSPMPSPLPAYVNEFTQALGGVDADTVMFTVDGMDVTAEYFFYWLSYDCYMMDMRYQMYYGTPLDFEETGTDGTTMADFLKQDAQQMATVYLMLEKQAPDRGAGVTPEQEADLQEQKADFIAQQGQEGFDTLLRQQGLSEEMFDRLSLMRSSLIENMLETIPAPTDEEAEQYIQDNDLLRCKHILIRTVAEKEDGTVGFNRDGSGSPTNEDGTPYTGTVEEYNAAALEQVNDILAQLNAAEDPLAKFDELMNQYSQDPGLATYPDGYDFTTGEMIAEFEQGTRDLEYDAYSAQPVQTSDGYHIILRLRPDVTEEYRQEQLTQEMDQWAQTECTTTAAYDGLDVKDFYEKYTAHMQSFMDDGEDETASPSPSVEPSGEPSEDPSDDLSSEAPSESPSGEGA